MKCQAAVIGGGPAGLMAAETLAAAGAEVCLFEAMPTVGRKFLMAGKSGLNLTMNMGTEALLAPFRCPSLDPALRAFDAQSVMHWAEELGEPIFTGSSGRVFPRAMKASPLLRRWLGRLDNLGVALHTRWRWQGWSDDLLRFDTADGSQLVQADVTILATGGATWARLGSDGRWAEILRATNVPVAEFAPANAALYVDWSEHMAPHLGKPIKAVAWKAGDDVSRGEAILSRKGLEGSGIYAISREVRGGAALTVDFLPDLEIRKAEEKLKATRSKASLSNRLRQAFDLSPMKRALVQEWGRPMPTTTIQIVKGLKDMPVSHNGLRPLDEAISSAGGVSFLAVDDSLMLKNAPGVYCVGEMLDWEAPTGGYLITGCLASGRWAGEAAARRLGLH